MNKKYKPVKSRVSATTTLKRFFSVKQDADELNFEEIIEATGRTSYDREKNMAWLSNKWPTLKHYEFIRVEYNYNEGPRKFEKIVLLPEGKRALGRSSVQQVISDPSLKNTTKEVTPESVLQDVKTLRQLLPSFEITFDIRPKDL